MVFVSRIIDNILINKKHSERWNKWKIKRFLIRPVLWNKIIWKKNTLHLYRNTNKYNSFFKRVKSIDEKSYRN